LLIATNNNNKTSNLFIFVVINKYSNKERNIIKTKTLKNFEYYFVLFAKKIENFVKQKIKLNARFREKYKIRYATRNNILASFLTIQKNKKDLKYKKRASRKKRTLIRREATNQDAITTIR